MRAAELKKLKIKSLVKEQNYRAISSVGCDGSDADGQGACTDSFDPSDLSLILANWSDKK